MPQTEFRRRSSLGVARSKNAEQREPRRLPRRYPYRRSECRRLVVGPASGLALATETVLAVVADGKPATVRVAYGAAGTSVSMDGNAADPAARVIASDEGVFVLHQGRQTAVRLATFDNVDAEHQDGDGTVRAPMHGKVLEILVEKGASVTKGQRVAVVEAMKMEHALVAPGDGIVTEVTAKAGAQVAEGAKILSITINEKERSVRWRCILSSSASEPIPGKIFRIGSVRR